MAAIEISVNFKTVLVFHTFYNTHNNTNKAMKTEFCPNCGKPIKNEENNSSACGHLLESKSTAEEYPSGFAKQSEPEVYANPSPFSFRGRAGRSSYWFMLVVNLVVLSFLAFDVYSLWQVIISKEEELDLFAIMALVSILCIPLIVWNFAVQVRRCHDLGWSGWVVLIQSVPFIGQLASSVLFAYFGFVDGHFGPNRYGPDPKGRRNTCTQNNSSDFGVVSRPSQPALNQCTIGSQATYEILLIGMVYLVLVSLFQIVFDLVGDPSLWKNHYGVILRRFFFHNGIVSYSFLCAGLLLGVRRGVAKMVSGSFLITFVILSNCGFGSHLVFLGVGQIAIVLKSLGVAGLGFFLAQDHTKGVQVSVRLAACGWTLAFVNGTLSLRSFLRDTPDYLFLDVQHLLVEMFIEISGCFLLALGFVLLSISLVRKSNGAS